MTIKNGDMPAMPLPNGADGLPYEFDDYDITRTQRAYGLTKREQFAMAAMQGLLSMYGYGDYASEKLSEYAVEHADALLAALEKDKQQ